MPAAERAALRSLPCRSTGPPRQNRASITGRVFGSVIQIAAIEVYARFTWGSLSLWSARVSSSHPSCPAGTPGPTLNISSRQAAAARSQACGEQQNSEQHCDAVKNKKLCSLRPPVARASPARSRVVGRGLLFFFASSILPTRRKDYSLKLRSSLPRTGLISSGKKEKTNYFLLLGVRASQPSH